MKTFCTIVLIALISVVAQGKAETATSETKRTTDTASWNEFKQKYHKCYPSQREENKR